MNTMLKVYLNILNILTNEEEGQGMAEYGLILALVSVAGIAVLALLGPQIRDVFQSISDAFTGAVPAVPAGG